MTLMNIQQVLSSGELSGNQSQLSKMEDKPRTDVLNDVRKACRYAHYLNLNDDTFDLIVKVVVANVGHQKNEK